jgi:uncharacterized membrane protein
MKRLANWFVRGLVVVVPIVATIWLLTDLFTWIDNLVYGAVDHLFKIHTPGLGFSLAVVAITTIGWLASFLLGRWLERVADWLLSRIPLVRTIYGTLKDILQAVGGEKKTFEHPVVVTLFPGGTAKVLGFVTRDDLSEIGLPGEVAVLMQQSLNFAGNILIFPKAQVRALEVDSGKFMTFVMSGGLTGDLKPGKDAGPAFPTLHETA